MEKNKFAFPIEKGKQKKTHGGGGGDKAFNTNYHFLIRHLLSHLILPIAQRGRYYYPLLQGKN